MNPFRNRAIISSIEKLPPAYFALVMATGIVSIAAFLLGYRILGTALLGFNGLAFVMLWGLFLLRGLMFPRAVLSDFTDHVRGVGFFTAIAGVCVLGSQFTVIARRPDVGMVLWLFGITLWVLLIYGIFTLLTVCAEKPSLHKGIHGGWLVAVVAAQSIVILGCQLAPGFTDARLPVLFFCLVMWLGGGMLYIWMMTLIFYRYTFFVMSPADLTPPYWINMGAVAISTLAGTFLIQQSDGSPLLQEILPFIKGLTLFFWATATWWIPMLVTLGVWRHLVRRFPLRYDPLYWGAVFPLGMYTVCTLRLSETVSAPFLRLLAERFVFVAFAAWAVVFMGLVRRTFSLLAGVGSDGSALNPIQVRTS